LEKTHMPHIIVTKPFSFAHHGYQVEAFEPADKPCETSAECAELALAQGWAKAAPGAPENKDAAPKRRTKADSGPQD
jgi:hypothetical protein